MRRENNNKENKMKEMRRNEEADSSIAMLMETCHCV